MSIYFVGSHFPDLEHRLSAFAFSSLTIEISNGVSPLENTFAREPGVSVCAKRVEAP